MDLRAPRRSFLEQSVRFPWPLPPGLRSPSPRPPKPAREPGRRDRCRRNDVADVPRSARSAGASFAKRRTTGCGCKTGSAMVAGSLRGSGDLVPMRLVPKSGTGAGRRAMHSTYLQLARSGPSALSTQVRSSGCRPRAPARDADRTDTDRSARKAAQRILNGPVSGSETAWCARIGDW